MAGKPAARVTDPTACPVSGHGVNPIASGSPDVIFEGLAAARLNDPTACGGTIISGVSATVFINGMNAAILGSVGSHGNIVTSGAGTVIIGDSHTPASFIAPTPLAFTTHSQYGLVVDQDGNPLQGVPYRIESSDGTFYFGRSNAAGRTEVVSGGPQGHMDIHLAMQGSLNER